jgi:hypothetical protein
MSFFSKRNDLPFHLFRYGKSQKIISIAISIWVVRVNQIR